MTRELTHQLERLGQERQRLEALLAHIPAWQALMQLEAAAEPEDGFSRYVWARRKVELEKELDADPLLAAHRSVTAAIKVIEGLIEAPAHAPRANQAEETGTQASAGPWREPPATPTRLQHHNRPKPPSPPPPKQKPRIRVQLQRPAMPGTSRHDVEVMTTTGGTGHRVVTRSATIHDKPPVPAATEPARPAADAERRGGRAHHHA